MIIVLSGLLVAFGLTAEKAFGAGQTHCMDQDKESGRKIQYREKRNIQHRVEWVPETENYTPDDYKAGTQNWNILQHPNGWIYAANNYGLLEYDGARWHLYGIGNSTVVRALATDTEGRVYAGGTDDFGYFTPNAFGGLDYHTLTEQIPERYRQFGEVWRIFPTEQCLYVQTRNYIFLLYKDEHTEVIDPGDVIRTALLANGEFYVATARNIFILSANRLHALRGAEAIQGAVVCALLPYGDQILIATDFKGLYTYDGETLKRLPTEADRFITDNQLYAVALSKHHIALGTVRNGLVLTDLDGRNCVYLNRDNGLQNNTILSLLFDKQDNLWIGLDKGIDCVRLMSPVRVLNNIRDDYGSGYAAIEHQGTLFLGTNQGVYRIDGNSPRLIENSLGQVWNIKAIDGRLVCCHNRGLFEISGDRLTPIEEGDGVWNVQPHARSRYAIAGTYTGFSLLQRNGERWSIAHLNGFNETALYYQTDYQGNIWVLSSQGVERLRVDIDKRQVQREVVITCPSAQQHYSLAYADNEVIVSSAAYLGRVDTTGTLHECTPEEVGLPTIGRYLQIKQDGAHNLWFITDDKLYIRPWNAATGKYETAQERMEYGAFMIGGFSNIHFTHDGQAIVGGISGFRLIEPAQTTPPERLKADLYIRSIRSLSPHEQELYGESYAERQQRIDLPTGVYSLHIEYSGDTGSGSHTRYATRLRPSEKEFSPATASTERDLTALAPGNYTLDIRMFAPTGTIERSIAIAIARPWYKSGWMIVLYVVAGIVCGLGIAWWVRREIRRNKERIEAEKNEQLRAQEMQILQLENDKAQFDLRQKSQELSHIILSENTRKELTESIQRELRRTIDCLNQGEEADAKVRLQNLLQRLATNTDGTVDWSRFEDNFDIVNDQFIRRLTAKYPWLNKQEKRLCVYIKMGLQTKEIAPLLNISPRGVEMMRYRLRQKMGLDTQRNLKVYFNEEEK